MTGRPRVYHWRPEQEAELIRRFEAGERVKLIAHHFDVPAHAVDTRIDRLRREGRLRLRNRPWLPADDRDVLTRLAAGEGPAVIARAIGRSRNAVRVRICHLRRLQREAQAEAQRAWASPRRGEAEPAIADADQFNLELRAA